MTPANLKSPALKLIPDLSAAIERILQMDPWIKNRLFLLKEFAQVKNNNLNIPDPMGRSREFYEGTFGIIREAVEKVSQII